MTTAYRLSAFSFEEVAPKEKALQKEKGRIRLRGVSALSVSFVSFSLRLFRQRKAAKKSWHL